MSDPKKTDIKIPTTHLEQVEIMKGRNLKIKESDNSINWLENISYYRLTAYALTMKDPIEKDYFVEGSSFEQLLALYEFDRKLRLLLLGVLETIEISFRAKLSYILAHSVGPLGHLDKKNFKNEKLHHESIVEWMKLIDKSRRGELFIQHHFKKYEGQIPIWVAIEVTSFGFISKFFKNLNEHLKKKIAREYGIPYIYMESWLQTLTNVRNICAHYGRLYNKNLTFKPKLFSEDREKFNTQLIFMGIYIINKLLSKSEADILSINLQALIDEYNEYIEYKHIGFPANWADILKK